MWKIINEKSPNDVGIKFRPNVFHNKLLDEDLTLADPNLGMNAFLEHL